MNQNLVLINQPTKINHMCKLIIKKNILTTSGLLCFTVNSNTPYQYLILYISKERKSGPNSHITKSFGCQSMENSKTKTETCQVDV